MILPAARVYGEFEPGQEQNRLPGMCASLLQQQRETWPMCREGYASLAQVRTKSLGIGRYSLHLQFNPGRIVSTGAKVDPATIRQRRCFLCVEHLPPEQHAMQYGRDLLILCNPAPIFSSHFTISHREHRPQAIEPYAEVMLQLSKDLSPEFCTFYNGPRCGASAPDHFHFQAAPLGAIPAMTEAASDSRSIIWNANGVEMSILPDYGRTAAIFHAKDASAMSNAFRRFVAGWRTLEGVNEEPMMNVLSAYHHGMFRLVVFLRSRHRPEAYFRKGEAQVLVSPATVDIGGLTVTPRSKEFDTLTPEALAGILLEVSADPSIMQKICETMT